MNHKISQENLRYQRDALIPLVETLTKARVLAGQDRISCDLKRIALFEEIDKLVLSIAVTGDLQRLKDFEIDLKNMIIAYAKEC